MNFERHKLWQGKKQLNASGNNSVNKWNYKCRPLTISIFSMYTLNFNEIHEIAEVIAWKGIWTIVWWGIRRKRTLLINSIIFQLLKTGNIINVCTLLIILSDQDGYIIFNGSTFLLWPCVKGKIGLCLVVHLLVAISSWHTRRPQYGIWGQISRNSDELLNGLPRSCRVHTSRVPACPSINTLPPRKTKVHNKGNGYTS